jgi:hypothetical protein
MHRDDADRSSVLGDRFGMVEDPFGVVGDLERRRHDSISDQSARQ